MGFQIISEKLKTYDLHGILSSTVTTLDEPLYDLLNEYIEPDYVVKISNYLNEFHYVDTFTFLYGFVSNIYSELEAYDESCEKHFSSKSSLDINMVETVKDKGRNIKHVEHNGWIIPETCDIYDYSRYPREHFNITDVEKSVEKRLGKEEKYVVKYVDGYILSVTCKENDHSCADVLEDAV